MRICNPPTSPFSKGGVKKDELCLSDQSFPELLQNILHKGTRCRFRAKGHSMSPFIKDGDVLTISPLSSSLKIGNVVAFVHPKTERLTIHRVVGKKGDSYLMKGDNTLETDGFVPEKNILGLVTRIERNGRKIFLGFGYERFLIALLSHKKFLFLSLSSLRILLRPVLESTFVNISPTASNPDRDG